MADFEAMAEEEKAVFGDLDFLDGSTAEARDLSLIPLNRLEGERLVSTASLGHFALATPEHAIAPSLVGDFVESLGFERFKNLSKIAVKAFPEERLTLPRNTFTGLPVLPRNEVGAHKSCSETHYGFCETEHHAAAPKIRRLAQHLAAVPAMAQASPETSRHLCLLLTADGADSKCVLYVTSLLHVRSGQRLIVFLECRLPELRDGERIVVIAHAEDTTALIFKTHWQLAVELSDAVGVRCKQLVYKLPEPFGNLYTMVIVGELDTFGNWVADGPPALRPRRALPQRGFVWRALQHLRGPHHAAGGGASKNTTSGFQRR